MSPGTAPGTIEIPLPGGGTRAVRESTIVFLVGLAQFVNILDFVMVMPLGPDFATGLGIPTSHIGYIGGTYTAAAGASGLVGAFFLDRFDRRKALTVSMIGLVIGTALGGAATGLGSLIAARALAGVFGGPATSLSISIIADLIPAHRRGAAMGKVMGAFSIASVLGVPAGLELARMGGWRMPFFGVASLGFVVAIGVWIALPPLVVHLGRDAGPATPFSALLTRPVVQASYLMTACAMAAGFILIPNIATYLQRNLGYPRDGLGFLYAAGGVASWFSMRLVGRLVDRYGSARVAAIGCVLLSAATWGGFIATPPAMPVVYVFVVFMVAMAFRNVALTTLTSKVPGPAERARFMSLQSAVQHFASAAGAFLSSRMLSELPDGALVGVADVAWVTVGLSVLLPVLMWVVEGRVVSAAAPAPARVH